MLQSVELEYREILQKNEYGVSKIYFKNLKYYCGQTWSQI